MNKRIKENERYTKWKRKYDGQREKERFHYLRPLVLTALMVTILFSTLYYSFTGEYKFIGQETKVVQAEVISTEMVHHWMGYFKQRVGYSYEVSEKRYKGVSVIDKRIGKRTVGEAVKIKISMSKPERSKIVGHY